MKNITENREKENFDLITFVEDIESLFEIKESFKKMMAESLEKFKEIIDSSEIETKQEIRNRKCEKIINNSKRKEKTIGYLLDIINPYSSLLIHLLHNRSIKMVKKSLEYIEKGSRKTRIENMIDRYSKRQNKIPKLKKIIKNIDKKRKSKIGKYLVKLIPYFTRKKIYDDSEEVKSILKTINKKEMKLLIEILKIGEWIAPTRIKIIEEKWNELQ